MPRFVLLEHTWDGVHGDLMFEAGPRLRTWAIGLPVREGIEQPARALADHRRIYLDYEGPISGGRGTVRRLDRGVYEAWIWTPGLVVARLEGAQWAGEVTFRRMPTGETTTPSSWTFRLEKVD